MCHRHPLHNSDPQSILHLYHPCRTRGSTRAVQCAPGLHCPTIGSLSTLCGWVATSWDNEGRRVRLLTGTGVLINREDTAVLEQYNDGRNGSDSRRQWHRSPTQFVCHDLARENSALKSYLNQSPQRYRVHYARGRYPNQPLGDYGHVGKGRMELYDNKSSPRISETKRGS